MTLRHMVFGAAIALALTASPATAQQGYDGETFVNAVRERDGNKAIEMMRDSGTIVNARDTKGETGLIVAILRRDPTWTGYLLKEGADPNLPARNGDTPLIAAARSGFVDAARSLLEIGAKVDVDNRMGETALIVAVQQRNATLVKLLLEAGANPDKADSAAGYSARDYAKRDTRSREILKLIEAAGAKQKAEAGPKAQ